MTDSVIRSIEPALNRKPVSLRPLTGGCVAEVYRVRFADGGDLVVKIDSGHDAKLDVEGFMLERLRDAGLRVPRVEHATPSLLAMEYIENDGRRSTDGEAKLGQVVAEFHSQKADRYGLERDTLIGSLDQPNGWSDDWAGFYAEQRIAVMADRAERRDALPSGCRARLKRVCARMHELIPEPQSPALIHGDLWAGNILWHAGRQAALIDPAVYYGDPEIELAFIDLMGGLGPAFWEAYREVRRIDDGFHATRCALYQLYPLLVHAVLFGGGYGQSVDAIA
ncbi:MAG: fructosamine kinase family protein, partial [Planctomycetota bacterium]